MNLFDKFKSEKSKDEPIPDMKPDDSVEQEVDARGWAAITEAFEKLYPGQDNPLHYGTLIPWQLGGNDPLRGISIYDGGDYLHFVSYGLSELYEKESEDPEWSGYGFSLP